VTDPNVRYCGGVPLSFNKGFLGRSLSFAVLPANEALPIGLVTAERELPRFTNLNLSDLEIQTFGTDAFELPGDASRFPPMHQSLAALLHRTREHRVLTPIGGLQRLCERLEIDSQSLVADDPGMLSAAGMQSQTGRHPTAGRDLFRRIRAVKSDEELDWIRLAGEANATGVRAAATLLENGRSWNEVEAAWKREFFAEGGEEAIWDSSPSDLSIGIPVTFDWQLVRQQMVAFRVAGSLHGYWSVVARPAFVGDPLPRVVQTAKKLAEVFGTFHRAIRAGAPIPRIAQLRDQFIFTGEVSPESAIYGLGLDWREYPFMTDRAGEEFEAGMVVTIELHSRELGWGCLSLADSVIVTHDGADRVNDLPFDLLVGRS
jgi:Xaa-Pro aminopeptidase